MKIYPATLVLLVLAAWLAFGPPIGPQPPQPPAPVPVPVDPPQPEPPPVVDTNPIPGPTPGLRVLILREAQDQPSQAELATINSPAVVDLLNRSCVRNVSGNAEWRVWDDDMRAEMLKYVGEHWRAAYERAKKDANGLPWLLIGSGTKGKSVKLPASADELKAIISEFQ